MRERERERERAMEKITMLMAQHPGWFALNSSPYKDI
jgi:hypothetical protein